MILFYILSFVILISSLLLITYKNPIYSVLSLVSLFVSGSLQLLLLEADFLAFVFIIVYVGAVAVLFLFVVIILDIKQYRNSQGFKKIPFLLIFYSLIFSLSYLFTKDISSNFGDSEYHLLYGSQYSWEIIDFDSSLNALGQILYNQYAIHFVLSGVILLVAIIGAIVLTLRVNKESKTQKTFKQSERFASLGKFKNS